MVLSCSYLVDEVRRTMGDGAEHGVRLSYAVETDPLGTAGGVRNAVDLVRGLVVVLNGDVLADLDLSAMLRFHAERGSRATLYLTRVPDPTQYGLVELDPDGAIRAFVEKPDPARVTTDTVNAGVYALDRSVVTAIPTGRAVSIERETFPALLRDRVPFFGWVSAAYWLDIGSPAKYRQGQLDLLAGKVATDVTPPGDGPDRRFVAAGVRVAADAALIGALRGRRRLAPGARSPGGSERGPRREVRHRRRGPDRRRDPLGRRHGRSRLGPARLHRGLGGPDRRLRRARGRPRSSARAPPWPTGPASRSPAARRGAEGRGILSRMAIDLIRNFSIVAHIDHGKSTLADRLLSLTGTMDAKKAVDQVLDSMDLEKERGITIKAHTVRLLYKAKDGQEYTLNLIDTPGHVDFSYEVSRSLAACEGAILIVDAAQGVEAQTLANFYLALDGGLEIIPVINKIDLPAADVEGTRNQITEILSLDGDLALAISAKHGTGVPEVLEAIVARIPPPKGDPEAPLKALVFDSFYDSYQGVVVYVRLIDGRVRAGAKILLMSNGKSYEVQQVGVFSPDMRPVEELSAGQVGYLTASIKRVADAKMGETITDVLRPTTEPCPGYRDAKPMVFAGLYPIEDTDYEGLRDALEKLRLNDSAFNFEPETSLALGYGFRCGFLGMLHLEIVQERLEREFNLSLIVTAPSVRFKVVTLAGETLEVENPSKLPPPDRIERIEEPYVRGSVFVPTEFMSEIYKLAQDKRGEHKSLEYVGKRVHIQFDFPLSEIVVDFYDRLKSISKGYASFDYEFLEFRPSDMVKLDILLNGDPVDALSIIVHREKAYEKGKALTEKLRAVIPRQLYEVAIQAAIGSRVIARETVKAMGKNVTAKCYGGDITRKRKLLEKQKEGKKRMKQVGRVEVPQEAFLSVLKS